MKKSMMGLPRKVRGLEYTSYVALLSDIIDADPSNYEEVAKEKWKKSMIKEY